MVAEGPPRPRTPRRTGGVERRWTRTRAIGAGAGWKFPTIGSFEGSSNGWNLEPGEGVAGDRHRHESLEHQQLFGQPSLRGSKLALSSAQKLSDRTRCYAVERACRRGAQGLCDRLLQVSGHVRRSRGARQRTGGGIRGGREAFMPTLPPASLRRAAAVPGGTRGAQPPRFLRRVAAVQGGPRGAQPPREASASERSDRR